MGTDGVRRYDIHDASGKRIYVGVMDAGPFYYWGDGFGFVDKLEVEWNGWQVVEAPR